MSRVDEESRWAAVLQRRPEAAFVYAVTSTRIYCRPTCPARRPRRENAVFFDAAEHARSAGFRACLRCAPDDPALDGPASEDIAARTTAGLVAAVVAGCRAMVAAGGPLAREDLEEVTGLAGRAVGRAFTGVLGTSARSFGDAVRTGSARALLRERGESSGAVSEAVFDSGFGSVRAFYDIAAATLGMTPSAYAAGAGGQHLVWAATTTGVGDLLAVVSARGICAVRIGPVLGPLMEEVREEFPRADLQHEPEVLAEVLVALTALAAGGAQGAELPLDVRGTAFQARVWAALQRIPAGSTRSYTEVAHALGAPTAVRAVARACAANRVALVVPCHRVVRGDGGLGGFRWGLAVKQSLLDAERAGDPVTAPVAARAAAR